MDSAGAAPRRSGSLGRVAFVGQWFAVFLAPLVVFPLRASLCGCAGWWSGPGLFLIAPLLFLALSVPALLSFADRRAVETRTTGTGHGIATVTLWLALAGIAVTIQDGSPPVSLLQLAAGDRVASAVPVLAGAFAVVAGAAWLVAVSLALDGVLTARKVASRPR